MTDDQAHDLATLHLQHGRLLRLAQSLLRDPHDAEDAVSHAVQQAATGRRREGRPLAAFLRTAIRRFASNLLRAGRTRRKNEIIAARDEAVPGADELVAREQLRRRVADAVIALPEPYRTTVWLCYLEELPAADVARRLAVAESTVRVRLHRARELLRARLDRDYDGRAAWAGLALPLLSAPSWSLLAGVLGGFTVKKGFVVAATLFLATGGSALAWLAWPAPVATHAAAVSAVSGRHDEQGIVGAPAERIAVAATETTKGATPVQMQVLHDDGRPAAGLPYWTWPGELPSFARLSVPHTLPAETNLPPPSGTTSSNGRLPEDPAAPVTVQPAEGILVTWLRPGATVHLPRLAEIYVALLDAPADPHWEVSVYPVVTVRDGWETRNEIVQTMTTAEGEAFVGQRGVRRRLDGATAIALPAATGVQLLVQADPLGFRVAFARPVFAPASVEFRCVGLQPTFRVRLLAADDTTPLSRPIYVRIETNMSSVYRESPIGEVRCNLYEDCTILALADDEVFTTVFHAGSEGESKLDCVQGQGRKLWRVGARNGVEVQSVWWQRRGGDWQPAKLYLTSRSPCLLRNADHLDLYGFETTNARVFVISSSGRVLEAVDGGQGQWLPTRPLPAVDQDALYQRLGGARRRSWSAQLLLPGEGQETWATFREWASASGNPPPKWTPAEAPVDCAVRLVARTDEQESILPWPSR